MDAAGNPCLDTVTPLRSGHASAAILMLGDDRFLLQLRDMKPGIFYPGYWGCFGGGIDEGETGVEALCRELREELGLDIDAGRAEPFTRVDSDLGFAGRGVIRRHYYRVCLDAAELGRVRLGEGREIRAFTGTEVLLLDRLHPADAIALWLYINRDRLR